MQRPAGLLAPTTVQAPEWVRAFAATLPGVLGEDWPERDLHLAEVEDGYGAAGGVGISLAGTPLRFMIAVAYREARGDVVGRVFLPVQGRSLSVDSCGRGLAKRRAAMVCEIVADLIGEGGE